MQGEKNWGTTQMFSFIYKNVINFHVLKLYRLAKFVDKTENLNISTQRQLEVEMPVLLASNGESELNSK